MEQQSQPPQSTQQPSPSQQPAYYGQPMVSNPGDALGIVGIVLAFIGFSLVGIFLSIFSYKKSKEANMPTTLGTVGIVFNAIFLVLGLLVIGFYIMIFIVAASSGGFDNSSYRSY